MLKNYFKIAIAVLKRRKFFTFISLFGISFTLTILMVASAFLDKMINTNYPDYKRDRSLYITTVTLKSSKEGWMNRSGLSFHLINRYISTLKIPEKIAFFSSGQIINSFVHNQKISIEFKFTDANFWDVLDYRFLEGKPYTAAQINAAEHVAVISEKLKAAYFGADTEAVGKYIEADNIKYRVSGVFKNVSSLSHHFSGDMYLPYTVAKSDYKKVELMGPFRVILLAKSASDVPKMRAEYDQMVRKVPTGHKEFDVHTVPADSGLENYTREFSGGEQSAVGKLIIILSILVLVFLLLPTINLININITRIMERSSEIGVRKAFGASSKTLVVQFLVENIILTGIGGILGVIFSLLVLYGLNHSEFMSGVDLSFNFVVLSCSIIACLFFGLLSGVYPAYKMSKMNIVKALKA
ncbi:ABC transporter permease [Pedobacter duraquae]|uniref:Putative ABC transport system permease protein n=1 Tax=Pedobacter duraquae TaxID=425511 RepID=A0A4R6IFX3_9SPHI|nr:ABC transporter permease [Pedobacter duraquae]TDO20651.1 putative ABC transport system permease protein [Pedobacter duraquae]